MMKSKRGLSDIVSNVLIILLVIVAVGIVAGVLIPMLKNTGGSLSQAQLCQTNYVEPVLCNQMTTSNGNIVGYEISYKRNTNDNDVNNLEKVEIILQTASGLVKLEGDKSIKNFEIKKIAISNANSASGVLVSTEFSSQGKKQTCASQPSSCQKVEASINVPAQTRILSTGSFISFPLEKDKTITEVFQGSSPSNGMSIFKFNSSTGSFLSTTYLFGSWSLPSMIISAGEGYYVNSVNPTLTLSFSQFSVKEPAKIRIDGAFALIAIPYCYLNFQYNASKVLSELRNKGMPCRAISAPAGNNPNAQWYSDDLTYPTPTNPGSSKVDFNLATDKAYWLLSCTAPANSIWTPSCV